MIIVDIAAAVICITSPQNNLDCHNALVGADTPKGTYVLQERLTSSPFYGGNILQFREDETEVYAIHRLWLGKPSEHRDKRIKSSDVRQRRITKGCINVEPSLFDLLVKEHSTDTLIIK